MPAPAPIVLVLYGTMDRVALATSLQRELQSRVPGVSAVVPFRYLKEATPSLRVLLVHDIAGPQEFQRARDLHHAFFVRVAATPRDAAAQDTAQPWTTWEPDLVVSTEPRTFRNHVTNITQMLDLILKKL